MAAKLLKHFTLIVCPRVVGLISSTSCFIAAVPRNKSNCVPGGSNPKKHTRNQTYITEDITDQLFQLNDLISQKLMQSRSKLVEEKLLFSLSQVFLQPFKNQPRWKEGNILATKIYIFWGQIREGTLVKHLRPSTENK